MLVRPRWRVKGEFLFLLKQAAIGYTTALSRNTPGIRLNVVRA